jgi:agmatine/peptidylarginine deiminase
MKRLLTYILVVLFATSSVLETYMYITSESVVLTQSDNEDGEEGKEVQKETEFAKDKICTYNNGYQVFDIPVSGKFIITNSSLLPHPYIATEINPPNTAACI